MLATAGAGGWGSRWRRIQLLPRNGTGLLWPAGLSLEGWLLLAAVIGAASGLFASFFYVLLELATSLSARIVGIEAPLRGYTDLGIAVVEYGNGLHTRLAVLLVVVAAAAVSSLIVYRIAPEAEGHGTDAAIKAFHRLAGYLRPRVPLVKAVASAVTIGGGGSGGVEGPSALMGAGVGSALAQWLGLGLWVRRTALVAGMAGALSSLFRAPMGTALFAVEVLFRRDIAVEALIPAIIASVIAYAVTLPFWGYGEVFPRVSVETRLLYTADALVAYLGLAVVSAGFGLAYVRMFHGARGLFERLIGRRWLRPIAGAAVTGAIGLVAPCVLGSGRQLLTKFLEDPSILLGGLQDSSGLAALVLVAVALAKMAATSMSIGSGGSGGVFAPGVMAGALLGYAYGLVVGTPLSGVDPLVYAYLGMSSFFAAASKTPLATSVMVAEMSGNYGLLVPALFVSYLAREFSGEASIYESQLPRRIRPELISIEAVSAMLGRLGVRAAEVCDKGLQPLPASATVAEAIEAMARQRQHVIPVVDHGGRVLGVVDASMLEELLAAPPDAPLSSLGLRRPIVVSEDDDIAGVIVVLEEASGEGLDHVVVVDRGLRYRGVIRYQDVAAAILESYLRGAQRLARAAGSPQRRSVEKTL
ncbi:chloride channel protein [Pyrodictium abyssi]|uniref:chloride channel protein n=1 Tax=Pyrodictium abyssi TaxID=54256 RepID=UPI0030C6DCBC